jgi:hypothetical protein
MIRAHVTACLAAVLASAWTPAFALKEPVRLWEEVYVRVRPGATVQARFHVSVESGYFVVASGIPDASSLHPLALRMKAAPEVQLGQPAYPAPTADAVIEGAPPFRAYEGLIAISLPITAPAAAEWSHRVLQGELQYQICSAAGCREPSTLPVAIEVELTAEGRERQDKKQSRTDLPAPFAAFWLSPLASGLWHNTKTMARALGESARSRARTRSNAGPLRDGRGVL